MGSRPTRVVFTGFEPFWMQVLVSGLSQRHSSDLECSWVIWPSTLAERIRFARAMLRADVIVRVGMPFEFQSETNRLWASWISRSSKVGINYWIGSDARDFALRDERGLLTARDRAVARSLVHFAGASNITELLAKHRVEARTVVFPSPDRDMSPPPPHLPAEFRALLYWIDGKFEYSGGDELLEAARALPQIGFDVVGTTGADVKDRPANMTFHGRVESIDPLLASTTVLVRVPVFDAVPGGMVEEALVFGRHVIYSQHFPHTIYVQHGDAQGLIRELTGLKRRFDEGTLGINQEGRDFIVAYGAADPRWALMRDEILRVARHR